MADLASAQAAITESINQSVNDAIANALKPGGVLHAFHTRT
jgi:predicted methyltransferase